MSIVPTSATFKRIVSFVNENDGAFASEVAYELKVSIALASSYLKIAAKHGLLTMGHDKSSRGKLIRCYYATGAKAPTIEDAEGDFYELERMETAEKKAEENIVYPSLLGLNSWVMIGFKKYGTPTTDF